MTQVYLGSHFIQEDCDNIPLLKTFFTMEDIIGA